MTNNYSFLINELYALIVSNVYISLVLESRFLVPTGVGDDTFIMSSPTFLRKFSNDNYRKKRHR